MADSKNSGQFGNRPDTKEQASKGGSKSGGNFKNDREKARRAGRKGGRSS
jgi:uncharacterized protein